MEAEDTCDREASPKRGDAAVEGEEEEHDGDDADSKDLREPKRARDSEDILAFRHGAE